MLRIETNGDVTARGRKIGRVVLDNPRDAVWIGGGLRESLADVAEEVGLSDVQGGLDFDNGPAAALRAAFQ